MSSRGRRTRQPKRANRRVPTTSKNLEWADSQTISAQDAASLSQGFAGEHPPACICTTCTCGTHKCPPDIVQGRYANNIRTEAQDQFRGDFVPAARAQKQQYVQQHRPFEGMTTAQADFVNFGTNQRRKPSETARGNSQMFANNLPFEFTTTAKHDFRKWNAAPAKSVKDTDQRPTYVEDRRNFATEASAQFQYQPTRQRPSCAPELTQAQYQPFEGVTTNRADFTGTQQPVQQSFARTRIYRPRQDDRHFVTEARGQFFEKAADVCAAGAVAVGPKEVNGHVYVEYDETGTLRRSQRLPVV